MSNKILEKLAKNLEEKILQALKDGTAPWLKPWDNTGLLPYNPYTGTIYQGTNALLLSLNPKHSNEYLTFNQIKELGGSVKRGEKAHTICFAGFEKINKENNSSQNTDTKPSQDITDEQDDTEYRRVFKTYSVFNISQCELDVEKLRQHQISNNIPIYEANKRDKFAPNPIIEEILANSNIPIIHHNQDKAYYERTGDKIYLPPKQSFSTKEQYYSTALHELGHATGHPNRLNREKGKTFGDEQYAKEELKAELYSFLQAMDLGIDYDLKNHASYVGSWLKTLNDNPQEISYAIKDSIKMVNYVKEHWYPKELKNTLTQQKSHTEAKETDTQIQKRHKPIQKPKYKGR